jgi:hypothetical protein
MAGDAAAAGVAAGDAFGGRAGSDLVGTGVSAGIGDGRAMLVDSAFGVAAAVGSAVGVLVGEGVFVVAGATV